MTNSIARIGGWMAEAGGGLGDQVALTDAATTLIAIALWGWVLVLLAVLCWPRQGLAHPVPAPQGWTARARVAAPAPAPQESPPVAPPWPAGPEELRIPVVWYEDTGEVRVQWAELIPPG